MRSVDTFLQELTKAAFFQRTTKMETSRWVLVEPGMKDWTAFLVPFDLGRKAYENCTFQEETDKNGQEILVDPEDDDDEANNINPEDSMEFYRLQVRKRLKRFRNLLDNKYLRFRLLLPFST